MVTDAAGSVAGVAVPDTSLPRDIAELVREAEDDLLFGGRPTEQAMIGPGAHDEGTLFRAVAVVADAMYVVDAKGRIVFLNPTAVNILGYADEEELLGRPSHETIHYLRPDGSPYPTDECPLLSPRVTGVTVRVEQDWFVRKDGTRVLVSYSSAPVDLDGGRGAVVAFQDMSHRLKRGDVEASRARIVAAADETRRRIERDLHDGAQQRLVSLGFELRGAAAMTPPELTDLRAQLCRINAGVIEILDELREIARGLHPAVLTQGGLDPALKSLARRSAIPVELDVHIGRRMPERVEVAAYYLVSEALTNAAKHSRASVVHVEVAAEEAVVLLAIRDNGVGGADPASGSGLIGLRDRVEALDGILEISSPAGEGTALRVSLPVGQTVHARPRTMCGDLGVTRRLVSRGPDLHGVAGDSGPQPVALPQTQGLRTRKDETWHP